MKSTALGAGILGGVVGALLGAGAMLTLLPRPAGTLGGGSPESQAALSEALDRSLAPLVAELRAARGVDARMRRTADSGSRPVRAPSEAPEAPPPAIARALTDETGSRHELRPEGARWTPEPRIERLRDLRGFMDDAGVRQRWLFTGQREALTWFGTPTLVDTPGGSEEIWVYELPDGVDEDGDEIVVEFRLMFVHGRLAQVHGDGAKKQE